MNNSILTDLLKEYEKTRFNNITDLENRKKELYLSNPNLQEIDNKISKLSINSAKLILNNKSKNVLNNLKDDIDKLKKEKETILKKLNLSPDYLKPKYNCQICQDTGYVLENGKTTMCNCLKQKIYNIEYNQKNKNIIVNQNFNNFNINLFSDKINEKKYNSNISPRENILYIKNASLDFINNFENEKTKNLIFSGGTGLRKNISF
jgi:DNA replication protein DnaC